MKTINRRQALLRAVAAVPWISIGFLYPYPNLGSTWKHQSAAAAWR